LAAVVVAVAAVRPVPLPQEPEVAAVLLVLLPVLLLAVEVLRPVLLLEVVVDLAHPAHKLLPLVLLQVEAVRPVPLPQQPAVAAVAAVAVVLQGLVASETLRSR
jgi:hypothetical protein